MVKPINNATPQSTPTKTGDARGVSQPQKITNAETAQNNESTAQQSSPLYNDKARLSRRAEHSMSGEAWAIKLQQQFNAATQVPKAGSMTLPRVGWETDVRHSENNPVPTPYPDIASTKKKDK
jgi:ATP sulfurylase